MLMIHEKLLKQFSIQNIKLWIYVYTFFSKWYENKIMKNKTNALGYLDQDEK